MTCEDCLHNDVCYAVHQAGEFKENAEVCKNFKNKADFVEVVRCKDCKKFIEYSDDYKFKVEGADGDCFLRQTHSYDEQFIACRYNDFCSYGKRKER